MDSLVNLLWCEQTIDHQLLFLQQIRLGLA